MQEGEQQFNYCQHASEQLSLVVYSWTAKWESRYLGNNVRLLIYSKDVTKYVPEESAFNNSLLFGPWHNAFIIF